MVLFKFGSEFGREYHWVCMGANWISRRPNLCPFNVVAELKDMLILQGFHISRADLAECYSY